MCLPAMEHQRRQAVACPKFGARVTRAYATGDVPPDATFALSVNEAACLVQLGEQPHLLLFQKRA